MQRGGSKYISFVDKVKTKEEPDSKYIIKAHTQREASNRQLLMIKSRPKKSRDIIK
jgi:hypothetical protein